MDQFIVRTYYIEAPIYKRWNCIKLKTLSKTAEKTNN